MSILFQPIPQNDDEDASRIPFVDENHQRSNSRVLSVERNTRLSRNSTGVKEEFLPGPAVRIVSVNFDANDRPILLSRDKIKDEEAAINSAEAKKKDEKMLLIVFVLMLFVGLGNKIFNKLMTIPMYNYPNFLNLLTTFIYIPVSFAYIIPMVRNGVIPKEQTEMSKRPFAVMGALDAMAGILQIFAATYLSGPLVILLSQAAIPVSMVLSRYILKATYNRFQYAGAFVVAGGIVVVLAPAISGGGSALWAVMMILSTIPMALSSVYKEIALGETELDPIYLNGWIAIFQFLFSLLLCVPSSFASDPPVALPNLPQNLYDGLLCYFGTSTITCSDNSSDSCVPDKCFPDSPTFVTIYLFFNQLYNLLIILILKYGSANLLFMAMTLMVPLGNVAFTLPFVPSNRPLAVTDVIGLVIICLGLGCYRFAAGLYAKYFTKEEEIILDDTDNMNALLRGDPTTNALIADLLDRRESIDRENARII